ncbi:MAG: VWA domain-containing protein [Planctomycetaceae bacterium]|nr:VWA domain-containing protein [Planctomycetaceae bacterium]
MSSASLLGGMPHDSSDDARRRGARPPAAARAKTAPAKGSEVVEDLSDFEEITEDEAEAAAEGEAASRPARGGITSWLRPSEDTLKSLTCMGSSALMHMVGLILAALIFSGAVQMAASQAPMFEVADITEYAELERTVSVELEPQLALLRERSDALQSSSPVVGVAGGSVSGGGGGSGGGVRAGSGSGSGPGGAPIFDASLLNTVGNGSGSGGIGSIMMGMPSSSKLIVEAPDGQIGDARAIVGTYEEALDRLTQEFLWMLDKNEVLVVWLFDQSESMKDDQKEIRERFEHVYDQLGLVSNKNKDALETAICSFGQSFVVHTRAPTSDRNTIRTAIDEVPNDKSGKEIICSAVQRAISVHRGYALGSRRQMALVLVTDESGDQVDNNTNLEKAVAEAKSARCKVFVLGREAVFGYPYAYLSWKHPQTERVHWLQIDRGPETAFVEQLQTNGFHRRYDAHPSGFGSYECARLGQETGGIFFLLPSLETNLVHGQKIDYDLEAMRPYVPDMRSRLENKSDIDASPLKTMLTKVIYDLNPYNPTAAKIIVMRTEFSIDPQQFVAQARQEQGKAIVYLDYLARAEKEVEKLGRARRQEPAPRWQANYDLVYAQIVAYQARMYEYGAALEDFINKPKTAPKTRPPNLLHVHWDITTVQPIRTGEKVQPYIDRATAMFKKIVEEHKGTPWAARAQDELRRGFGIELRPDYDAPDKPYSGTLIPVPKM